jgi:hypothetical protein
MIDVMSMPIRGKTSVNCVCNMTGILTLSGN